MGFIYLEIVLYDWRPEESDDLSLFPVTCVPSGWRVMLSLLRFGWRCIQKKIPAALLQREHEGARVFQTDTTSKYVRQCTYLLSFPLAMQTLWVHKLLQFDFLLFKGILMFSDKLLNTTWCIKGRKIDCKMRTWNHKGAIITQCFS